MLRFVDLGFIILFAVVLPLLTVLYFYPNLKRLIEAGVPDARLIAYRQGVGMQWLLTFVALGLWGWHGGSLDGLGFGWVGQGTTQVGLAILVGVILALAVERRRILRSSRLQEKVRTALLSVEAVLPHTRKELHAFYRVSVTAGICEEVLYRGFLIGIIAPVTGVAVAYGLSSLLFGFAHLYQGAHGVARTTAVGVVFGGLFLLTGSLWGSMLLHIFFDINSGQLCYWLLQHEDSGMLELNPS